jgi:hypothetical protein
MPEAGAARLERRRVAGERRCRDLVVVLRRGESTRAERKVHRHVLCQWP